MDKFNFTGGTINGISDDANIVDELNITSSSHLYNILDQSFISFLNGDEEFETNNKTIAGILNDVEFKKPRTIKGNFHQGAEIFSEVSRGKQCVANSLIALCLLSTKTSVCSSSDIDTILMLGDEMYRYIIQNSKSSYEYLELCDIPKYFKINEKSFSVALIGDGYHGLYHFAEESPSNAIMCLDKALENCFQLSNTTLIIMDCFSLALLKISNNAYALFDSHSRDNDGKQCPDGFSVVIYFPSLTSLIKYLHENHTDLNDKNSFMRSLFISIIQK